MVDAEVIHEALLLPCTTAECETGPVAEHRPASLSLCYDAEAETGIVWTAIEFELVCAARFTAEVACLPWMIRAYSRVCEFEGSGWLHELRAAAASQNMLLSPSARHFFVYFDHVGCWEVMADDVQLGSPLSETSR